MKYLCFVVSITSVISLGCSKETSTTVVQNHPPEKPTITAEKTSLYSGESTKLWSSSSDIDGDKISYSWSATGGSFDATDLPSVTWLTPNVASSQTYKITLDVQDTHGAKSSNSLDITVLPLQNNPSPTTIFINCYKDVFVSSAFPDSNLDIANQDFLGTLLVLTPRGSNTGFKETRIYVYFDLASIPPNVTIDEATIMMQPYPDPGVTTDTTVCGALLLSKLNFGAASTSWSESGLTWNTTLNTLVSSLNNSGWLFMIVGGSSELKADIQLDVQAIVNGNTNVSTNYNGWVIRSFSTSSTDFKVFWSSDCNASSYFPKLKVTYH